MDGTLCNPNDQWYLQCWPWNYNTENFSRNTSFKKLFFFNLLKHLKSKRVWTMVIHKWEWLQHLVYHDGSQGVVYSIYNSISWKADTDVNYHAVFYWFVCTDNELLEGITITCVYKPSRYFSDSWSLKEPLVWWIGRK